MHGVEQLRVIHLRHDGEVISVTQYPGDGQSVALPVRAIVADSLALGTAALVIAHNHPSGDPTPSNADLTVTAQLKAITKGLGIHLHDHLIYGESSHTSFRALGLL